MRRRREAWVVGLLALASCGRDFEPASSVRSLRVLAVAISDPFAKPGQDEHLEMLVHDASPKAARPDGTRRAVSITWFGGCDDPPGDLYYRCYPLVASTLAGGASSGTMGHGDAFDVHVPADVISSRKGSHATVPYGLSFVVYAACGGALVSREAELASSPPLGCVDESGADLGPDDFVVGYVPIYAYDAISTKNPVVTGGSFDARGDATACVVDADCGAGDRCGSTHVCLETVAACAGPDCPSHVFRPDVDPSSAEPDQLAEALAGLHEFESLRVSYYATAGTFSTDQTRASDVTLGYVADYETNWTPPAEPVGEVRLFAVVRDNRGGSAWWTRDVWVR